MKTADLYQERGSQRQWMEQCGGSLAGYIAKYGSASDPQHYGDGGEAIYAADKAALEKVEALYEAAVKAEGRIQSHITRERNGRSPFGAVAKARALLETVEFPEGGEDWSLLANATTALDMILERRPK